jgi:Protein of unknown function (DUF2865)
MRLFLTITMAATLWAGAEGVAQVQSPVQGAPPARQLVEKTGLFDLLFGREQDSPPVPRPSPEPATGTYRTMCVRLCDGFYFPISFATTRDKFSTDAGKCERQCPSRSRLFVYRNPGQSVEEMVDLKGEAYSKLATADRFNVSYVPNCTCRGNPWDPEATARHQSYPPAVEGSAPTVAGFVQRRSNTPPRNRQTARPSPKQPVSEDDD